MMYVIDQCWPECGVLVSSTSYSGFSLSLVQLIAWTEDTYIGLTLSLFILSSMLRSLFSPSRSYYTLSLDYEMHWHCEDNGHIYSSYLSKNFVMRCFGIVRTIPTSSSSWPRIIHLIWWCASYRSWGDFGYLYEDDTILRRLWSTLWIGYYSGRKTSAIQLYLADLHWQRRTEHSILHWSLKLWDAISMWKADLEKERCVLTMFCIQKKVVQIPCVNHFVLEKLVSLWLMSWLFTVGWEPVWFENFWKCFDVFEFILWKVSFVDL